MTDPPTGRFKLAACLYAMGQGGRMKVLADACSLGVSTLRRWLELPFRIGLLSVATVSALQVSYVGIIIILATTLTLDSIKQ